MLLNLTNRYYVNARDYLFGRIWCWSERGPSFGNCELETYSPLLGKDKVMSWVARDGFLIGGKVGEINPLTGDIIKKYENWSDPHSRSTAIEIEVWQIETETEYA